MSARVAVLTRDPVPGRVKTRLIPAVGAEGAARLHRAFALHTVETAARSLIPVDVLLDGAIDGPFAAALRAAGARRVLPQAMGDLGARIGAALTPAGARTMVIGTDCLLFSPRDLQEAAGAAADVVLGPADDGGYWLIAAPASAQSIVLDGIPWSTGDVLARTRARASAAGLSVRLIAGYPDVDEPADLDALRADPRLSPSLLDLLRG